MTTLVDRFDKLGTLMHELATCLVELKASQHRGLNLPPPTIRELDHFIDQLKIDKVLREKIINIRGEPPTEVGQIVEPIPPTQLRSGGEAYGSAIVISVEPFVLVSKRADMRWSATIKREKFVVVGLASPESLERCMTRL
jgi:hypothetical protein